ncbi:hypothetical protein P7H17_20510 [Paenibacillus larvae]|nr:hypothetical protein [Paenibacillus larvae]MDT2287960.1 hypothetical protein [Paenibacillus larvae]
MRNTRFSILSIIGPMGKQKETDRSEMICFPHSRQAKEKFAMIEKIESGELGRGV